MNKFPERLQALREAEMPVASRMVKSQLCGLGPDAIRRYERGEVEPKLGALIAIAEHYAVSIDYLAGLTDCKTPNWRKKD